ncbi:hypothetical protein OR573_07010 [Halomonas sp. CH40]
MEQTAVERTRLSTGIEELDEVMKGGLPQGGAYLVKGGPGSGKTTLCLQFLTAGKEPCLLITFGEREH